MAPEQCAISRCEEPMDTYILVCLEIPPVRFEAVELEYGGGVHKSVTLDNETAVISVYVCIKHGARIIKLREAGKRAMLPVATFGPMEEFTRG